jgi:ketosteroid isomerase-like protein
MKTLKTTIFRFLVITLFFNSCSKPNSNITNHNSYSPVSIGLYDTIVLMDSILFDAFNARNFDKLKTFFSDDLEFYHDQSGVTNYQQNINAFKNTFEGDRKVRREVELGSLEVYPIKDFGAVETGTHRFYATEKGQKEKLSSEAKFVHLWRKTDTEWKITRVISYGHKEF